MNLIDLAERRWLPDWLIRAGIRQLLDRRINQNGDRQSAAQSKRDLIAELRESPLALHTETANDQHYEVPAEFFQLVLGPRLKYSCCLFPEAGTSLADAEEEMLRLTCQRAELENGQDVLELGCGWGSLTLWMAENYPGSRITAVSNSQGQREFIENCCRQRGLNNVRVITADMREFATEEKFDRVVSIEMFEHMRNWQLLLERIASWLTPRGKLFVHIFCHRETPYLFQTEGAANWMGRHFFTGGMMPSEDLLSRFAADVTVTRSWRVDGLHYARTCDAWLERTDRYREAVTAIFRPLAGNRRAPVAVQRWRMFFMACAELFKYRGGNEWFVGHYLLEPTAERTSSEADAASAPSVALHT